MKLRLLGIFASIMLMFFVFSPPVFATATQCGIHKGNEWRCAKDNYQADTIRIGNESTRRVDFKVGIWTSTCGKKGSEISNSSGSLESRTFTTVPLLQARANQCVELFVYDCTPDVCTKVISAHTL
ncbi:MAG TPA: hypothetical protein V6C85_22480 [Allocoleopsis sp.]